MNTRVAVIVAGGALCASAAAQTPSFTYSIDAPASLSLGQTTTVTVWCGFSPGIGAPVTTPVGPAFVLGLASGSFDLLGSAGAWTQVSLLAPYNFIGTTPGTIAGGSVTGVLWGTGFGPHFPPTTTNPILLWTGTYTAPAMPGPVTLAIVPVGAHIVWAGANPSGFPIEAPGPATGAEAIISVIPAPASLALVAVGLLVAARRCRDMP